MSATDFLDLAGPAIDVNGSPVDRDLLRIHIERNIGPLATFTFTPAGWRARFVTNDEATRSLAEDLSDRLVPLLGESVRVDGRLPPPPSVPSPPGAQPPPPRRRLKRITAAAMVLAILGTGSGPALEACSPAHVTEDGLFECELPHAHLHEPDVRPHIICGPARPVKQPRGARVDGDADPANE